MELEITGTRSWFTHRWFNSLLVGRLFCSLVLCIFLFPATSYAAHVALVIGNSKYPDQKLKNPANDAKAVAAAFTRMGYDDVQMVLDAKRADVDAALDRFSAKAESAEVAVIYYAGHGVQIDGVNYAVPLDVSLKGLRDKDKLTSQEHLSEQVARASRFGLVILDACRDNPFAQRVAHRQNRSVATRGLARVENTPLNTLVAYATAADDVAADGDGLNSPYTTALLEYMEDPSLEVVRLFGKVKDTVYEGTNREQLPYYYSSLGGSHYFLHPKGYDRQAEFDQWDNAMVADTLAGYQNFLNAFPDGRYAPRAERFVDELMDLQNTPITIDDLQLVSSRFERLKNQFQQREWQRLSANRDVSKSTQEKFERIQKNKSSLTFAVKNFHARKKTQTIYADIVVENLSDGAEFEVFPLTVSRDRNGAWSAPTW